ncbi:hypothetical protein DES45_11264 [Microvirga subterranea]|uniref:Uncharacterized protein n=1 Tax=Microvirga subterranea TaxID=186651 RepID=A0A370HAP1_9HYPH|nr:hypothetical protein DES45_11264 [Microvirga subterranea]
MLAVVEPCAVAMASSWGGLKMEIAKERLSTGPVGLTPVSTRFFIQRWVQRLQQAWG